MDGEGLVCSCMCVSDGNVSSTGDTRGHLSPAVM